MKFTQRQVNVILRGASFTPDKGPIKVMADVGDFDYFTKRAREILILLESSPTKEQRREYLNTAIKLIVLAVIYNENN